MKKNKPAPHPPRQAVWDLPVRLLHWALVLCVAGAWFTRDGMAMLHQVHEVLGYSALAIATARLGWGLFFGNHYARFKQFVHGVQPTLRYLRGVATGKAPRYLGHNPLGGWMVLALLACVGALGFTGWLYTTDMFWGYGWLANLHAGLGWALLVLVGLHVAGVLFTSWQHRENLVAAMFTGNKGPAQGNDVN